MIFKNICFNIYLALILYCLIYKIGFVARKTLTTSDTLALEKIKDSPSVGWASSYGDWIRILRTYLRMSQMELAQRSGVPQPHLVRIESGKTDPRVSTLKKIYEALSCHLSLEPVAMKPLEGLLRGRARSVVLERLKQSAGTMALEGQAPEPDLFRYVLETKTDELLNSGRKRLPKVE